MPDLKAYILAGGRSQRFGSDKARALADGRPLIARLADAVRGAVAADPVVVARRAGGYGDLGLRTIGDVEPDLGPMGGLRTALADAGGDGPGWVLLLSCDLVAFQPGWVERLSAGVEPGVQAVAFRGERVEPLCALYHTSCLPAVLAAIAAGDRAMHLLLAGIQTCYVPLPPDWPALAHVNTPGELRRALGEAGV